jgi:hypothetical protein
VFQIKAGIPSTTLASASFAARVLRTRPVTVNEVIRNAATVTMSS